MSNYDGKISLPEQNVANNVANGNSQHLTEQWRNGELFGFHYVKEPKEKPKIHNASCMDYLLDKCGVEVLAPVPDYDEWKTAYECQLMESEEVFTLKEQLKEANDVIKKYRRFEVALKVEKGTLTGVYPAVDYLKKWGIK